MFKVPFQHVQVHFSAAIPISFQSFVSVVAAENEQNRHLKDMVRLQKGPTFQRAAASNKQGLQYRSSSFAPRPASVYNPPHPYAKHPFQQVPSQTLVQALANRAAAVPNSRDIPKSGADGGRVESSANEWHEALTKASSLSSKQPEMSGQLDDGQLVIQLWELLLIYENGIDVEHVNDLYYKEYGKDLPLDKMTSLVRFFMYHADLFRVCRSGSQNFVTVNRQQDRVKLEQDLIGPMMTQRNAARTSCSSSSSSSKLAKIQVLDDQSEHHRRILAAGKTEEEPLYNDRAASRGSDLSHHRTSESQSLNEFRKSIIVFFCRYDQYLLYNSFILDAKPTKLKSVYTSDTKMTYQDLPAALNDVSDEYAFIVIGEIYSPGKFYWFLRDSKMAIEKLSDEMTLVFRTFSLNLMNV